MPRVREVEAFRVVLSKGRRPESVLLRLTDHGGMVAWGEVAEPEGADLPEGAAAGTGDWGDLVWADVEERVAPALLGLDWDRPEDVSGLINAGPGGSAGDMACWDLWCRLNGVPLAHAMGGSRTSVVAGARLAAERETGSLLTRVNRFVCAGYSGVTLRVVPGWDVEPVRAVRQAYPALAISVDAGAAYDESGMAALEALDAYGISVLERPFRDDLPATADLQIRMDAPVAPDVTGLAGLDAAIETKAGRAVILRVSRAGGLDAAREAHARAFDAGWEIGCAGERGVGVARAAAVALASLPGVTLPSDVTDPPPKPGRGNQSLAPELGMFGGVVAVPLTQPGIGHRVDEDVIRRMSRQTLRLPV
ncbi:enolase C-terminal domain-like protein [Bailinhaonella thermotolerans]|uniref:O-succinylbenzoate-CoA synthase n=1 Tax=Bailinhaonella thermotolerans TaxID=1070861 RepID=A0A3A4B6D5_9ACTN|nr:enolase C-terminal domain-like protein [Bailinhaonella thermotolerans]RJL34127.1 O-succinylbenzoate-CoA synthase [Bailinhaonella thermotolerans]